MFALRSGLIRFFNLFRRHRLESDLEQELGSHLDMETEENIRKGMSAAEAARAARIRLGGVAQAKEIYRDQWGLPRLESILKDVRFSIRSLLHDRGFTIAVVLTLTLGIASNVAVFSLVNAILIDPLPYPDSDRLVRFYRLTPEGEFHSVSAPNFEDWRAQQSSFVDLAASDYTELNLTGIPNPLRVRTQRVTPGFFTVSGVKPLLGSTFPKDTKGTDRLAVINEDIWERGFGRDPDIIGRQVLLDDAPFEVIGVMPVLVESPLESEVCVPLDLYAKSRARRRTANAFSVLGRTKPGVSRGKAQAEIDLISRRIALAHPDASDHVNVIVRPLKEVIVGDTGPRLLALMGAVFFVLLIACLNTANLMLTRGASRLREMAVRTALGAGRGRLLRQLLIECSVLAFLGSLLGLAAAWVGIRVLAGSFPKSVPRLQEVSFDSRILLFVLAAAVLSVLLFGLLPALRISRVDLGSALKEGALGLSHSATSARLKNTLVIGQVALSAALVIGSGLLVRSYWLLNQVDLGFETEGLLTAQAVLSPAKYKTPEDKIRFLRQAHERLASLPGVEGVGVTNNLTFSNWSFAVGGLEYLGRNGEIRKSPRADFRIVTPEFFRTLGIRLLAGRMFGNQDTKDSEPAMIIDRNLADQLFPDEQPLGRKIKFLDKRLWTIVGVVEGTRDDGPFSQPRALLYVPFEQYPVDRFAWTVKTSVSAAALGPQISRVLHDLDPEQPIYAVRSMQDYYAESISESSLSTLLMLVFAGAALSLAALGIYAVLAHQVASRTREIGIRMAVGAPPGEVFRFIATRGFKPVLTGLTLGVIAALGLTRFLSNMLFNVRPLDPWVFSLVVMLLLLVAAAALAIPAQRAASLRPHVALRWE